jgi:VIT1/CCC1 family predicted Fe2+/Mn2+ transporter
MVSKDQAIGGAILLVCVVVAVVYLVALFGVPVFVAFVAILFIGAWIGWTMATTPPPKPIEEITTEIEDKKEEPKVEETESMKATDAPSTEDKPAAKKKK